MSLTGNTGNYSRNQFRDGIELYGDLNMNGNSITNTDITFADGSESAPSIAFTDEPTVGIYRPSSGKLSITDGNLTVFNFGHSTFDINSSVYLDSSGSLNRYDGGSLKIGSDIFTSSVTLGSTSNIYTQISAGTLALLSNSTTTITGVTTFNNTTDTTSKSTGSVILKGGMGIEKSLWVDDSLNIGSKTANGSSKINLYDGVSSGGIIGNISSTMINLAPNSYHIHIDSSKNTTDSYFAVDQDQGYTTTQLASMRIMKLTEGDPDGTSSTAQFFSETDATSSTAAGFIINGGLAVAKKVHVGTNLTVDGNIIGDNATSITGIDHIRVEDGLVSAPALHFRNDLSTGMYYDSALGLAFGGVNVFSASTGVTTLNNTFLDSNAIVRLSNTTEATSSTAGAVIVNGGLAVNKSIFGGVDLSVPGDISLATDTTKNFTIGVRNNATADNLTRTAVAISPVFTSGSSYGIGISMTPQITSSGGNDNMYGVWVQPVLTQFGSASVAYGMRIQPPTLSGTFTNTATVYIGDEPATGTNRYALLVDAGESRFDGDITANGNIVGDGSTNISSVSSVSCATVTASGDITANGDIVGDLSTNITGINSMRLEDGSVTSPAIHFRSGLSTGMYYDSALGLAFGGVNVFSANSGTTTLNNSFLDSNAIVRLSNTNDATSKDTGSIVTEGGVGIEKNCYIGGNLNVTGTITGGSIATEGHWHEISRQTASSSSSIDFSDMISTTYDQYRLVLIDVYPATDGATFLLRNEEASSFVSSGTYSYENLSVVSSTTTEIDAGSSETAVKLTFGGDGVGNVLAEALTGEIKLFTLNGAGTKHWRYDLTYWNANASLWYDARGAGRRAATTALTGCQLLFSSGNIAAGEFILYGMTK